jgi:hypothetical protein
MIRGAAFQACEKCGAPFPVFDNYAHKYCDTATCGHAAAQAKYRAREAAKEKQQPRRPKRRGK